MPRVTVCLAVYNGAEHLPAALDSVFAQTYRDFNVLVLDDGSTDNSAEVASRYDCRLIRQENAGLGEGRRRMVEEADGDLIAFIDHDDEWLPDKLIKQVPLHDDQEVVLSHTAGFFEHFDGRTWTRVDDVDPGASSWDQVIPLKIIASSVVFSRAAMLRAGNFAADVRICSDWYGWLHLAPLGKFEYVREPLVKYLVRQGANSEPGIKFHEADRYLIEDRILPNFDELAAQLSTSKRADYRRKLVRWLGKTKRDLAHHARLKNDRALAMRMHREAVKCDPGNLRYWLSWIKNALIWRS